MIADFPLKYGCNPHQLPANIYKMSGGNLPFKVCSLVSRYSLAFSVCSVSERCSSKKGMCGVWCGAGKRPWGAYQLREMRTEFVLLEGTRTYAHLCIFAWPRKPARYSCYSKMARNGKRGRMARHELPGAVWCRVEQTRPNEVALATQKRSGRDRANSCLQLLCLQQSAALGVPMAR